MTTIQTNAIEVTNSFEAKAVSLYEAIKDLAVSSTKVAENFSDDKFFNIRLTLGKIYESQSEDGNLNTAEIEIEEMLSFKTLYKVRMYFETAGFLGDGENLTDLEVLVQAEQAMRKFIGQ